MAVEDALDVPRAARAFTADEAGRRAGEDGHVGERTSRHWGRASEHVLDLNAPHAARYPRKFNTKPVSVHEEAPISGAFANP
jgi:hypothetical protein